MTRPTYVGFVYSKPIRQVDITFAGKLPFLGIPRRVHRPGQSATPTLGSFGECSSRDICYTPTHLLWPLQSLSWRRGKSSDLLPRES